MNLRKIAIFAISLIVSLVTAPAQERKVEVGISAGYGYNLPRLKDERMTPGPGVHSGNLNGFHAGPMLKLNFTEQFGLQTGALFNHFSGVGLSLAQKNLKKTVGTWNQQRYTYSAIDIPLRLVYSVELADEFYFFVFAGPNFNYSLNKVIDSETYVDRKLNSTDSGKNIYSSKDYSPFDTQIGAGLGVRWKNYSITGGHDWGISNRTNFENVTLRANDLKVTLSYIF